MALEEAQQVFGKFKRGLPNMTMGKFVQHLADNTERYNLVWNYI